MAKIWGLAMPLASAGANAAAASGRPVEGPVAAHRHAMPVPAMREVVEHGVMLGGAVVPEGHRARAPLEAAMQFRRLDMPVEHFKERVAFVLAQLRDAERKAAIDEQRLPAGHRMGA